MRRLLSILLGLCLGLGPALAAVPANALTAAVESALTGKSSAEIAEASLPACCRKHGVHHCNMGEPATASNRSWETSVSAMNRCPCWPAAAASAAAPFAAIFTPTSGLRCSVELRSAPQAAIAAGISERRTWPKRGPPASPTLSI